MQEDCFFSLPLTDWQANHPTALYVTTYVPVLISTRLGLGIVHCWGICFLTINNAMMNGAGMKREEEAEEEEEEEDLLQKKKGTVENE